MTINMTDCEPLERIHEILGGKLRGPYDRSKWGTTKPTWVWAITRWEEIERAYQLLAPWLSPRRIAQCEGVLAHAPPPEHRGRGWQARLVTHCPRGHEYTPENTRLNPATGGRTCRACAREKRREQRGTRPEQYQEARALKHEAIRKMRAEGSTQQAIADTLGVSLNMVKNALRQAVS